MLKRKLINIFPLIALLLVFIMPFLAAYQFFYSGKINSKLTNKGELLTQAHNLTEFGLVNLGSEKLNKTKKWRSLYLAPNECDLTCQQILHYLQQVHIALGKHANNFEPLIIHLQNQQQKVDQTWLDIAKKHAHMNHTNLPKQAKQDILNPDKIYLADPMGNIILSYDLHNKDFATQLFKDTKKLISISKH